MTSTWRLAKPARIAAALAASQAQNSGGWFVAGASADVGRAESVARTIAGREVVFWRDAGGDLVAGPALCPHLGALMDKCPVLDGTMYCRWHGMAFTAEGDRTWSPYRAYDDGVLIWVGLPTDGRDAHRAADAAGPAAAERVGDGGDRASRGLRAAGRDRQPAGPLARVVVPPVRVLATWSSTTTRPTSGRWWST